MAFSAERLRQRAADLGFPLVGVIRAEPANTLGAYFRWIEAGMHGSMGYLAREDRQARRRDLRVIFPTVRSLVVVGMDYTSLMIAPEVLADPARGRIASYAWGFDYHAVLAPRLEELAAWLMRESGGGIEQRVYVDTGAILERAHAQAAGLGFIGKNTMLIHPRRGSYFFLGELLTGLEFDGYDVPGRATLCGRCTRCLEACPTGAFPEPYVLDARRCISYLTIEHKGVVDPGLRGLMGNWVFGCDVCQEVCPWQRFARPTGERVFYPLDAERAAPLLVDLLALDEVGFREWFGGSPVERIGRERLVRNGCIAAGNWGDGSVRSLLVRLMSDESGLIRECAGWALERVG